MQAQIETLDCGHAPSEHGPHTTGTGRTPDGRHLCWDCCNAAELADFLKADSYTGYLSNDGTRITTWPGGTLARVTREWEIRNNMAGRITRIQAVDETGARWYGTSPGRGMYTRLHRSKARR